jgi:hypothetical protein
LDAFDGTFVFGCDILKILFEFDQAGLALFPEIMDEV